MKSTKEEQTPVMGCDSCEITSEGTRMCPCPRADCDAEQIGTKTITTVIDISNLKLWVKEK